MKTKRIIASLFFLLCALAAAQPGSAWDGGEKGDKSSPEDEIPELTDVASLQAVFNQDTGHVRLVALLSPSCGYCIKGYRYMRKILDEVQDERLKMYVVWEPMLSGDSKQLAERMSRKAKDPRMVYLASDDVLRITCTPKEAEKRERLAFYFEDIDPDAFSASLALHWDTFKVSFKIEEP